MTRLIGRADFEKMLDDGVRKGFELRNISEWLRLENIDEDAFAGFLAAVAFAFESSDIAPQERLILLARVAFEAGWDLRGMA